MISACELLGQEMPHEFGATMNSRFPFMGRPEFMGKTTMQSQFASSSE
jgi:hypothetical protein